MCGVYLVGSKSYSHFNGFRREQQNVCNNTTEEKDLRTLCSDTTEASNDASSALMHG